jgi:hypothetical protein
MKANLESIPPQIIRDSIIEVLATFNSPVSMDELETYVAESLEMPYGIQKSEELKYLHRIINDMKLGGKIEVNNKNVSLSTNNANSFKDYNPEKIDFNVNNVIEMEGSTTLYSVGSQYYQDAWNMLDKDEIVQVEIFPEEENPYDKNAIAVIYRGSILGHLTRTDAQEYYPYIQSMKDMDYVLRVNASVDVPSSNISYKYLKLFMPSIQQLESFISL